MTSPQNENGVFLLGGYNKVIWRESQDGLGRGHHATQRTGDGTLRASTEIVVLTENYPNIFSSFHGMVFILKPTLLNIHSSLLTTYASDILHVVSMPESSFNTRQSAKK